jgi:hypothetical protein
LCTAPPHPCFTREAGLLNVWDRRYR